jgi:putative inorganic carbon (HCO3(-)) transporter
MLASAGTMGLDAFVQYFVKFDLLRHRPLYAGRITGPFQFPNDFAAYLVVILPAIISLSFSGVKNSKIKWLIRLEMLFLLIILVINMSRGAWLGLMSAIIFMGSFKGKRKLLLVLLVLSALLLTLPTGARQRIQDLVTLEDTSSRDRKLMWQGGWNMFKARPIMGHGLGTFMANYEKYRPEGYTEIVYAHNCYLQMAAEIGILGLAVFIWMMILLFYRSIRSFRQIKDRFCRSYLIGLLGGILAYLVHSSVDTNLYSLPLAVLFWFILGLAVGIEESVPK